MQGLIDHAVGIELGRAIIDAVGNNLDLGPHLLFGAAAQLGDGLLNGFHAIAVEQHGEAALADGQGRCLGLDIADALIGDADIAQDDREDFLIHDAALEQLDRRQAQTLLLDLGGGRREAARHGASGIGPMAGVGQPGEQLALIEEGFDEANVHQMGAAEIGIVDHIHVAGHEIASPFDDRAGAELHGADEDRQAEIALGDEIAIVTMIDPIRTIKPFRYDRRKSCTNKSLVHFVANLDQAALDHRQSDRIEFFDAHGAAPATVMMRLPKSSAST